jgi:hypothetical protein
MIRKSSQDNGLNIFTNSTGELGGTAWKVTGTLYTASGKVEKSDRNAKNNIETLSSAYNSLFDKLNPIRYKYNDGTSDRFHTGFIAQDTLEAATTSGLSSKDFAAVCIQNPDTENEQWGIRYTEIVPLNTWQIQLLKPRMTAAEEKIAQLELEISQLKSEIQNLKNAQNSAII